MNGGDCRGAEAERRSGPGDQIDNLEERIASDTVNIEVNADSYRCLCLRIAG